MDLVVARSSDQSHREVPDFLSPAICMESYITRVNPYVTYGMSQVILGENFRQYEEPSDSESRLLTQSLQICRA